MKTALPVEDAAALIPEGAVLLIGGFMGVGSPHRLIDALVARGVGDLGHCQIALAPAPAVSMRYERWSNPASPEGLAFSA